MTMLSMPQTSASEEVAIPWMGSLSTSIDSFQQRAIKALCLSDVTFEGCLYQT